MRKFTLFLIHGIGIHRDAGWADETKSLLQQAWQSSVRIDDDLKDHIKIVPISYDEVFEDYLNDFSDVGSALFSDLIDIDDSEKEAISTQIENSSVKDKHFVFSYLMDVLLYKMSLVKSQVNVVVAKQLYHHISKLSTSDNFGIIAHSLGTRVINDTLQSIRTGNQDEANFYRQGYRLKFLMQISDVTDLFGLPFQQDKYPPKDVYSYDTYDYLRTVTNRFDPIARIIPTRLDHWPEGRTTEMYMGRPAYKDILLDHVHELNVHGLAHYMLHPQITDEVFELCGFGRLLQNSDERIGDFPLVGPKVSATMKEALNGLMLDAEGLNNDNWQTYVNLVLKVGEFQNEHETEGLA